MEMMTQKFVLAVCACVVAVSAASQQESSTRFLQPLDHKLKAQHLSEQAQAHKIKDQHLMNFSYTHADGSPTRICGMENVVANSFAPSDDAMLKTLDFCKGFEVMTSCAHKRAVLGNLKRVLDAGVPGAIVELGCHRGAMSVWIRQLLDSVGDSPGGKREFHVYDSFQGVPAATAQNSTATGYYLQKGNLAVTEEPFRRTFADKGLQLPVIHKGFFADIPDAEYPNQIAFAFFDGDMYTSITDSFAKVYPKLSPHAVVMLHDYNAQILPGVETATKDFLRSKTEKPEDCTTGLGRVIKD